MHNGSVKAARMKTGKTTSLFMTEDRHLLWLGVWLAGMAVFALWAGIFLNGPALADLVSAFLNSVVGGVLVVLFSMVLGWAAAIGLDTLERTGRRALYLGVHFMLNLVRSIPQIVGILLGYIVVTRLMLGGSFDTPAQQILLTAAIISLVIFLEVTELIRQRIAYFRELEFYDAMLCCGISHRRIINDEILRKNSVAHLMHKAVAIFGMAIFLQCSIDFIVSVGLSTDVSSTNFPVTLGSLLARMDSKQDILAIGTLFGDPMYIRELLTRHLQGIGVAWTIVFTLVCSYYVTNGLERRYRL